MSVEIIAIVFDPQKPEAKACAEEAQRWLRQRGVKIVLEAEIGDSEFVLVFGGDGLVMHTARNLAGKNIPILGVNFGQLGFLTEVEPSELYPALEQCLIGRFRVEHRLMLEGELLRGEQVLISGVAVNDITLRNLYQPIDFAVFLNGVPMDSKGMRGDGVIIASPTGSTAYSFSAGGPIVDPEVPGLLLTFISPRSPSRPIIVPENTIIGLHLLSEGRPAYVSLDATSITAVERGDLITVNKAKVRSCFAVLAEHPFLHRLQTGMTQGQF